MAPKTPAGVFRVAESISTNPNPTTASGDGTNGHYHRSDRNWGPYPLEERPDAGITVRLNSCFSAHDPDGEEGPMRSVTESAEDVPGVDHAEGA